MTTGSAIALATERLVEPVEGMHHAIASRGFGLTGPLGRPIHRIHNTVAATVYASIRHGATLIGAIVDGSPLGTQTGSDALVPFVNAVWGDDLGDHEGRLALAMSAITAAGDPVSAGIRDLEATPHLVVLVHGLGQSEASWRTDDTPDLVDRLSADPGTTTLLVRYNTGRPIAANGFDLAALVESIALEWPVPVERLTLVGHSLGGLVCRSACVAGQSAGHGWVDLVSEVIATGAPHKGAPAEKAAHVAAWALGIARVTRPLAGFLNRRSRGIKDLRFGTILDSDWGEPDGDGRQQGAAGAHPLPEHIAYHAIATTIAADVDTPWAWAFGDGMVRLGSAIAPRGREPATASVSGGVSHFTMQGDPSVLDTIMRLLRADGDT